MRKLAFSKFGLITPAVKKSILRYFYKDLTGDASVSDTSDQHEIDERVRLFFELEEPDVALDLRANNRSGGTMFDIFWEKAKEFLNEDVGVAVDDCRHTQVVHIAKAISVRDFKQQVVSRCPSGIAVPCDEYLRLQFVPAHKAYRTASKYTGQLEVRKMVQQRQWRKDHIDSHYAACIFRYLREYCLLVKDHALFICVDDKHIIKVSEPQAPVAAAEKGRQVLVPQGTSFRVLDHDFTKFGIIPSVSLRVTIPDTISESWYTGQVNVTYKEKAFEASSPIRHATELFCSLQGKVDKHPILFLYSDGGPDHRVTYTSVKLSLLALYFALDLDYLCAAHTAPYHSFRNPVERVMAIINLGLQSVGLSREKLSPDFESLMEKCSTMADLREMNRKQPGFDKDVMDSIAPAKIILSDITRRLELKGQQFTLGTSATDDDMIKLWKELQKIDPDFQLPHTHSLSAKALHQGWWKSFNIAVVKGTTFLKSRSVEKYHALFAVQFELTCRVM